MTPEHAALCERLKADADSFTDQVIALESDGPTATNLRQAAAAIERLSAENEALRGVRETAFRAGWRAGFSGAMQSGPLPDEDTDLNKYITPALSLVK